MGMRINTQLWPAHIKYICSQFVDGGDYRCEDICEYVRSSHEQLTELTTPYDETINML